MTRRMFALLLAAALMLCSFGFAETAGENADTKTKTYYAYTENGKPLTVRLEPNGAIIGTLAYGQPVEVSSVSSKGWALITFHYEHPENGMGDWDAFVNRRYLIDITPEELEQAIQQEKDTFTGDPMTDIDMEFAAAEYVEPYRITARPARVTGWVNMRWIPSETGRIIAQYKETEALMVLKELAHYLQVQDPDTGDVGYIHKKFAAR